jgi:Uncharacterised protein family (UPF0158)
MALPVKLQDVVDAFDEGGDELSHYLDKRTGEIFMITDEEMSAAEEEKPLSDYPDWQQESILKAKETLESDQFVQLPSQFDIHEYSIMERFAQGCEDRRTSAELLRSLKGKGAFRRFKDTLVDLNIRDAWSEYRQQEFERIAIEWLEEEKIPYTRDDEIPEASATM